ncbi:MAG: amidohydrolase family protein, partial [Phycisphaerae bacterium]|nr:amidohydrolase family protein [Phycisphaerae bacterium]
QILDAIEEAVRIGRESGCRVQISHFKLPTDYVARVGGSQATLARVDAARQAGLELWLDQDPYTASSTSISTLIPDWVLANGREEARRILSDESQLPRVLESMKQQYEVRRGRKSMAYVVIAACREHPEYVGKNLQQIAALRKMPPGTELLRDADLPVEAVTMEDQYRAAIAIYLAGGATCVFHAMDEDQVSHILRHPLVSVASDSGVREFGSGQPHPRGYGTNARVLGRYVRQLKLISLEEAVRKMTAMPAAAFRFSDRGLLRPGFAADIVVFDPETVADRATFEQPHAWPEGFDLVVVNGQPVFHQGRMTGKLPGRPLMGPGHAASGK